MTQSQRSSGMTPARFIEYMQNCYSDKLHPDMVSTLLAYLSPFDELYVSCLARVVLLRHPRQYKTAPGIAELEKYQAEAYDAYQEAKQDFSILAIEADAGNHVDISATVEKLHEWMTIKADTKDQG